ncbi:MAG: hypothetical protein K8R24_15410 [Mycobacterium sp.]|nr:hypothetical protein [Mycobacterium sp.]
MQRILRGTDLRYTLTRLIQILGPMTVSDLCAQLENLNFGVEGRPTKVVSIGSSTGWSRSSVTCMKSKQSRSEAGKPIRLVSTA